MRRRGIGRVIHSIYWDFHLFLTDPLRIRDRDRDGAEAVSMFSVTAEHLTFCFKSVCWGRRKDFVTVRRKESGWGRLIQKHCWNGSRLGGRRREDDGAA